MSKPLKLLLVEDSENDAELIVRAVRRGGYDVGVLRVETKEDMLAALRSRDLDLVICDYSLPQFSAPQALELLRASNTDLPFIIVSGTIGEETAVAALKAGAHDFIIKNNLSRLVPAIERELDDVQARRERRQALAALREAELKYRTLVEHIPAIVYIAEPAAAGKTLYVSPQVEVMGYAPEEWLADNFWIELLHPDDRDRIIETYRRSREPGSAFNADYRLIAKDGHVLWIHDEGIFIRNEAGEPLYIQGVMIDITERKMAEEALVLSEKRFRNLFENSPVSVWEEDFSAAKAYLDQLDGTGDPETFLAENPQVVEACAGLVEIIDVNQAGLDLHEAGDKSELLANLGNLFTPEMFQVFRQELAALQTGRQFLRAESVMRTLKGKRRDVIVSWVPVPGYEKDYSRVLVSSVDITEGKQRERELEAIVEANKALRLPQTLDETLERVLDEALDLLQADTGSIWLYDPATERVRLILQRGWGETRDLEFGRGQSIPGLVVESGEAVISTEFHSDLRVDESRRSVIPEGMGGACVPLRGTDRVVGVLFVNTRAPRELTADEIRLVNAIAEIGGNAIQRMELLEQTRRQLEHLAALREIDLAISSSIDLRVTLNSVLEQVIRGLEVDAADVLLFNRAFGRLEYVAGRGFHTQAIKSSDLSLGGSAAGTAALNRDIVHITDLKQAGNKFTRSGLLADENFISYFGVPLVAKGEVKGVLEIFHRSALQPNLEWFEFLDSLGWQTAVAVDNALLFEGLQRSNSDLRLAYDTTIEGWSRALDLRDKETEGHTLRVTEMTLRLARAIGMRDEVLVHIRRGALLHDIGKMGVPDNILLKPDKLTEEEWVIMRKHPEFAYEMLKPIAYLREALDIPYCHHEKWDGSGYPRGLKGEQIPLAARLFAVVDVWDALTSDRPYRPAWPVERALAYIHEQRGKHFDPQVIEVFDRTFDFGPLETHLESRAD